MSSQVGLVWAGHTPFNLAACPTRGSKIVRQPTIPVNQKLATESSCRLYSPASASSGVAMRHRAASEMFAEALGRSMWVPVRLARAQNMFRLVLMRKHRTSRGVLTACLAGPVRFSLLATPLHAQLQDTDRMGDTARPTTTPSRICCMRTKQGKPNPEWQTTPILKTRKA